LASYIDLHNHILPDIDDGPRTMKEAVMQARSMASAGYSTVVATPHTIDGKPSPALIKQRVAEFQNELDKQEIPLKILPGAEQFIEPDLMNRLRKGEIQTINNSHYLLLELPMTQRIPIYAEQLIFALAINGYRPVIPHPERVVELQRYPKLLYHLYKAGAIYQITWGALTGWLGPEAEETAHLMLKSNLAHLVSTDAHNAVTRLLAVEQSSAALEDILGPGSAEMMLHTRPATVIANETLDLPAAIDPTKLPRKKGTFLSRLIPGRKSRQHKEN